MSSFSSIITNNDAEMITAGMEFASGLRAGDVVALTGGLGAGKTHFSKGIVAGLGAEDEVTSPTFSLVQEYVSGRLPVYHFDFYRLDSGAELISLGWDDYLDEGGVIIAEWADKFSALLPPTAIWIELTINHDGSHTVTRK